MPTTTEPTTAELADETHELRDAVRMLRSVLGAVIRDLYDDNQHRAEMLEALRLPQLRFDDPDDPGDEGDA